MHDEEDKTRSLTSLVTTGSYFTYLVSKADAVLERENNFYRVFSIVKYSYLPTDTFRKHVEMDVTCRKLALKFTGYGRQTR